MLLRTAYYNLKPLIPRRVQILLRRMVAHRILARSGDVWPIDEQSVRAPGLWSGWPEGKRFAFVLTHDVETGAGQAKCRDLIEVEERRGFRSSFNFVPERYNVSKSIRDLILERDCEVGIHGLLHDGKYFTSRKVFSERARKINKYIGEWKAVGYRSPSMQHNLEWFHDLDIEYDASTFDTDPFEPQPHGMGTIFPFWVSRSHSLGGYVELPYTLPQDFTLFVILGHRNIDVWKRKLDWIVAQGGMALLNTHPDYMNFTNRNGSIEEYPVSYYEEFLDYVNTTYSNQFWHVLPRQISQFWSDRYRGALNE